MANPAPKRPSILVTDAREQQRKTPGPGERPGAAPLRRPTSRFITVDNVLQYTSDIPSAQARFPQRPRSTRTASGRAPLQPKLAGRGPPTPAIPGRTSKVSEKLVLLPETEKGDDDEDDEEGDEESAIAREDFAEDNDAAPERDNEAQERATRTSRGRKSYAERLPKARRAERYARVTAYCTAQAFRLSAVATVLRDIHGAKTKLYDDCLYVVYHLPLLPGSDGYRVRSSPVLKHPGGKAVLDLEIERNERRDYADGYFEHDQGERYSIRGDEVGDESAKSMGGVPTGNSLHEHSHGHGDGDRDMPADADRRHATEQERERRHSDSDAVAASPQGSGLTPDSMTFAEMFIFSYGVVVFWNFTESQEKDILADLTFFQPETAGALKSLRLNSAPIGSTLNSSVHPTYAVGAPLSSSSTFGSEPKVARVARASSLVVSPLREEDFETEEFHFEYDANQPRPRIFNDMITLRSGDHMIKLTLAHAIAQSTKLSYFEQQMARQMAEAQHVPKTLALTGTLGLKRSEVFRILGALFRSRVDVNLSSSVLDTPDFFWTDEPPLLPLYASLRTYLEIDPRVKTLNERCQVFLDLAEMLSDSINDTKMSTLTWIIIILILISIAVTCTEVFMRFGLLSKDKETVSPPTSSPFSPTASSAVAGAGVGAVESDGMQGLELVMVVMQNGVKYLVANGTRYYAVSGQMMATAAAGLDQAMDGLGKEL